MITIKINPQKLERVINIGVIVFFGFYSIMGFYNIINYENRNYSACVNDLISGDEYCISHQSFFFVGFFMSLLMFCFGVFWLLYMDLNEKHHWIKFQWQNSVGKTEKV